VALIGAVPALLVFWIIRYVPESERWKKAAAAAPVRPLTEIVCSPLLKITMLASVLVGISLIGSWGSVQWLPLWADRMAGSYAPQAKAYTQALTAVGAIVGALAGAWFAKRVGRRLSYFVFCLGSLISCGWLFRGVASYGTEFLALTFVVGMFTTSFYGWLPLYLPELYPTRVRATGQGIVLNSARVFAAVGAIEMGTLMRLFGGSYARAGGGHFLGLCHRAFSHLARAGDFGEAPSRLIPAEPLMKMQQNSERILTTHVGSLPRPPDLLDQMKAKVSGSPGFDAGAYDRRIEKAVAESVAHQALTGIDIVNDGEQGKTGFFLYVRERLDGFESRPNVKLSEFEAEVSAFPEYYEEYFKVAMAGGSIAPVVPLVCVGPIKYKGLEALRRDIANLKNAVARVETSAAFMPSVAPSGVGSNEYYKSDEEYFHAVGAALRVEYQEIVKAGFILQIDDPFLTNVFADPKLNDRQRQVRAEMYVETVNECLRGIPADQVRLHTCHGINEGPRVHDADLEQVVGYMLKVNAGGYSIEAANPRHEHEYHLWESVKLPEGKVLIPGVISHASNIVEHPKLIAERLVRFAQRVGRENVIASADCGFSSQAMYHTEVHPKVIWAKFSAMREGARLASQELWRR